VYRQGGRLDRELIDWRAGAVISDLYQEVYRHLEGHPIVGTVQLLERLHSIRGAVHGANLDIEPAHSDGLWADLRQLCEDASWDLSRLQLAWAKAQRSQGQRGEEAQPWRASEPVREAPGAQAAQGPRREDLGVRAAPRQSLDDMDNIADQAFGEADL
jgi:hypothetical protein